MNIHTRARRGVAAGAVAAIFFMGAACGDVEDPAGDVSGPGSTPTEAIPIDPPTIDDRPCTFDAREAHRTRRPVCAN